LEWFQAEMVREHDRFWKCVGLGRYDDEGDGKDVPRDCSTDRGLGNFANFASSGRVPRLKAELRTNQRIPPSGDRRNGGEVLALLRFSGWELTQGKRVMEHDSFGERAGERVFDD
jgi:hypothetical protein